MPLSSRYPLTRTGWLALLSLLGGLALASWVIIHWDLDRRIAGLFYRPDRGWYLGGAQPWKALYEVGTLPGLALTLGALIGWAAGFYRTELKPWRRHLLLIALTSVLGGGLIVNAVLKPYWGRPRPAQVVDFGGKWEYHHLTRPGIPGRGQSFPCGHCTMGFVFVSLLCLRRRAPGIAWTGAGFGLIYGSLLGVARMAQGGHFLSDVIWSLGIIAAVAVALYYWVFRIPVALAPGPARVPVRHRRWVLVGSLLAAGIIAALFLTRRPFYESDAYAFRLFPGVQLLRVETNLPLEAASVRFGDVDGGRIWLHSRGFGWVAAGQRVRLDQRPGDGVGILILQIEPRGYFSELNHRIEVVLPLTLEHRLEVEIRDSRQQGS